MAISKRTTLRSKSSKIGATASKLAKSKVSTTSAAPKGPIPFLKQARPTKSSKLEEKQRLFASKVLNTHGVPLNTDPNQPGISKSAIRRRKRKQRDQLKPKMDDLMDSLLEAAPSVLTKSIQGNENMEDDEYSSEDDGVSRKKLDHTPNPSKNQNSAIKIEKEEMKRFGGVLKDESFRKNPFEALKAAIKNNAGMY